jgi:hypothetical protein
MIPLPAQIIFPKIDFKRLRPMRDFSKLSDDEIGRYLLSQAKAEDRFLTYDEYVMVHLAQLHKHELPARVQSYATYRRAYELKRVGFWGRAFGIAWHGALVIAVAIVLGVIAITAASQAIANR